MNKSMLNELFEYKDGNLYWKKRLSQRAKIGDKAGYLRKDGYVNIRINNKNYKAHRLVFAFHHDYMPEFIDHIDGNKANNKIENLRGVNHAQNLQNQKLRIDNKSGTKGVSWHKIAKKWRVQIIANKNVYHLGLFEDFELASLVAQEARDMYHKNYARHL